MTFDELAPGERYSLIRAVRDALASVDTRSHIENDPMGDSPAIRAQVDAPLFISSGWAVRRDGTWIIDVTDYMNSH